MKAVLAFCTVWAAVVFAVSAQAQDCPGCPRLNVSEPSGVEGGSIRWKLTLTGDRRRPYSVLATIRDATDLAAPQYQWDLPGREDAWAQPGDYHSPKGKELVVEFPRGTNEAIVDVHVPNDGEYETNEYLILTVLRNPGTGHDNANISFGNRSSRYQCPGESGVCVDGAGCCGCALITDNDAPPPEITVQNGDAVEGRNVVFTALLTGRSPQNLVIQYKTGTDGSAAGNGIDYSNKVGELTFVPGGPVKQAINVQTRDDHDDERQEERFYLELTNPSSLYRLATTRAIGTIRDNDVPDATITDDARSEPNGPLVFQVGLSIPPFDSVEVRYQTADRSARAGPDYTATNGTLTFVSGETTKTIAVPMVDDSIVEIDETFVMEISSRSTDITVSKPTGIGTIIDNDVLTVGVEDAVDVVEDGILAFTLSLNQRTPYMVGVEYTTKDGTATSGRDYVLTSGTATFRPGSISVVLEVPTMGDDLDEPDETLEMILFSPNTTKLEIRDDSGTGVILDDDLPLPKLDISVESVWEGGGPLQFVVEMSGTSVDTVTVDYETADLDTTQTDDYIPASGTLTFAPRQRTRTVSVVVADDFLVERDERLSVILDNPTRAVVRNGVSISTIRDDDVPVVDIADATPNPVDEGVAAEFGITLDQPAIDRVEVSFETADGTAVAGDDYEPATGTLTFAPGETMKTVPVNTVLDGLFERVPESFGMRLTNVSGTSSRTLSTVAELRTKSALAWIRSTDARPIISVDSAKAQESDDLMFIAKMTGLLQSEMEIEIEYQTSDNYTSHDTAIAGEDYEPATGTLTFSASVSEQTIIVHTNHDLLKEPDETMILSYVPANVADVHMEAIGTIIDDDDYPTVSAHGARTEESADVLAFTVTLDPAYPERVTVDYATQDGTAIAGADYHDVSGTLTFTPGETTKTVVVAIVDDEWVEPDEEEMFELVLSNPVNAVFGNNATGTIVDDDVYPTVSAHDARGAEDIGELGLVVELNVSYPENATVDYATSDNTATSPADYRGASGTLTFAPGETTATVDVAIVDDADVEFGETFHLVLSNPVNTVLGENATGTILDDDEPSASIGDASGREDAGELTFTVTLDKPSVDEVVLAYAAKDGTATAGRDYGAVTGTLTFAPGNTSMDVPVAIIDDHDDEPDETFTVELSAPQNTVIGDPIGTGTITDDDEPPVASRALPAELMLCVGGEHRKIDLSEYFSGEDMRFDADMSDGTIAVASIAGTILTVEPVDKGSATLTVTATNLVGSAGTGTRVVVVTDPGELNAVESTFAAIGQNTLGEVVEAVADRSEFVSWSVYESPGRSISVWNRNGARQFERGDVREGRLRSHQIGVDMQFGGWRVGVAGMTSAGNARYGYGKTLELCGAAEGAPGEGLVETDLDSIHPYAIRRLGTGSVWGTVGYGRGDSHLGERCGTAPEMDGGLSMTTIAAGGRHPFRVGERTTFSVVESVGMLRYDSQMSFWDGGGNRIEIGRARVGVEAVGTNRPECACILATYGRIWAQTEWGDGHTGTGMELDAGVRYLDRERRLGFDIGLWGVPFHSIRDHRELGVDAAFMFLPAHDGTGLRTKTIYRDGRTFTEVGYGFKRGGDAVVAFLSTGDSMTLAGVKHKWFELSVGRTAAGDNVVRFSLRWRGGSAADASAWDALHNTVRRQNGAAHTGQGTHGNMALRGM